LRRSIREQAPFWLDVTGRSMGDTIHAGSQVLLDAPAAPRIGEIWAFCSDDGTLVVHRSLGRGRNGFRFQGDGRIDGDPPVAPDRIIGRVREVRHGDHHWRPGWRDRYLRTARLVAMRLIRAAARRLPPPARAFLRGVRDHLSPR
jgi:hypothetical protein